MRAPRYADRVRFVGALGACLGIIASCSSFDSADGIAPSADGGDAAAAPTNDAAPLADAAVDGPARSANVIVTGEAGVSSVALDATHVYWTTGGLGGHVARCPRAGCAGAPDVLATNQAEAKQVAVAGERVVWIAEDTLRSVSKSGGPVFSTTSGFTVSAFVVFATTAYIAYGNSVKRCEQAFSVVCTQATPGVVATTNSLRGATRFESDLLVWSDVTLRRLTVPSLAYATWARSEATGVVAAAVEGEVFYVTKEGVLRAIPSAGLSDGGAPRDVAFGVGSAVTMAADVTNVYVAAETEGKVRRVAKSGGDGGSVELASGLNAPRAIAIDANEVYVAVTGTGQIVRLVE